MKNQNEIFSNSVSRNAVLMEGGKLDAAPYNPKQSEGIFSNASAYKPGTSKGVFNNTAAYKPGSKGVFNNCCNGAVSYSTLKDEQPSVLIWVGVTAAILGIIGMTVYKNRNNPAWSKIAK